MDIYQRYIIKLEKRIADLEMRLEIFEEDMPKINYHGICCCKDCIPTRDWLRRIAEWQEGD